ncbi:MAG: DNA primase [Alphaproteobacteria bacterium]|nr:DNA primase [Alphaproteobacteria bacterium]
MMTSIADLAGRLARDAEAVCRAYLPNGKRNGHYWHCGNVQGDHGQSLYVHLSGPRAGKWTDAATGEHGDLLDLIMETRRLNFAGAIREAREFLSLPASSKRQAPPSETRRNTVDAARRLFAASKPIEGTLAEEYLHSRGLVLPEDCSALRFHPRCYCRNDAACEAWPALIAAVTDNAGTITGVHRTWLDPKGGKAPLKQPRRALGHLLGNGVRFCVIDDALAAAEGLETALALKTVLPDLSVVAALSASHLAAFIPPVTVRRLYVAYDNDEAGCMALERLRERLEGALDLYPLAPRTEDFNDDLLTFGPEPLRKWITGFL